MSAETQSHMQNSLGTNTQDGLEQRRASRPSYYEKLKKSPLLCN